MSTSKINISHLVEVQTMLILQAASYSFLKQTILDRKPLPQVINAITRLLEQQTTSDKSMDIQKITGGQTNNPNLMQLSSSNYELLCTHFQTRDNERKKQMETASLLSYQVFLEQLELLLTSSAAINITLPEKNALLMTIQGMKEFFKMQEKEIQLKQNLAELQTKLNKQEQSLKNVEAIYKRHNTAPNKKSWTNKEIAEFTSVLGLSLFLSAGALEVSLVIFLIFIPIASPVLGIIPLAFALIGACIALVGSLGQVLIENNVINNDKQMEKTHEINTLYEVTIPLLRSDIESSQASIEEIEARLLDNQQQMQFQLSRTERITPIQQSRSGLFSTSMIETSELMMGPLNYGQVLVTEHLSTPRLTNG